MGNSVMLVYDIYKGVKDFLDTKAMVEDKKAFESQTMTWNGTKDRWTGTIYKKPHDAIVGQVLQDLDKAVKSGIIKKENQNVRDLTDIANIVMFGGNGNEGQEIRKTAERIINEVSAPIAKMRLLNTKAQVDQLNKVNSWFNSQEKPAESTPAANDCK